MENVKKFPKIALGTWSWGVGAVGGDQVFGSHLGEADLKAVFDTAMKEGLNLWDTATVYGMGASEDILGAFAKTYPREDVILSTKFTPQIAGSSADPVAELCDASMDRLGTDYIDIYWIHNPADVERWTPGLISLVKSGKVKQVGVSNHNLAQTGRGDPQQRGRSCFRRPEPLQPAVPFFRGRWNSGLLQGKRNRLLCLYGAGTGSAQRQIQHKKSSPRGQPAGGYLQPDPAAAGEADGCYAFYGRKTWRNCGAGSYRLGGCQRNPAHHRCDETLSGGRRRKSSPDCTERRGDGAAGNTGERGKCRHKRFLGKSHGMILFGEKNRRLDR